MFSNCNIVPKIFEQKNEPDGYFKAYDFFSSVFISTLGLYYLYRLIMGDGKSGIRMKD